MAFEVIETEIDGLKLINSFVSYDDRGFYRKAYEREIFNKKELPVQFYEYSIIKSCKGALRGLHYQQNYSQGKFLQVINGSIFDVALDLRKNSKTFGLYKTFILKATDEYSLFIPEGFAHGFLALEDDTYFTYLCTNKYDPESCGGILWNDPELNILWPIDNMDKLILTDKDKNWPTFRQYCDSIA